MTAIPAGDVRLRGMEEMRRRRAKQREARFEDFTDLVAGGTHPVDAARRVGSNASALSRQAYRHRRYDIAGMLNRHVLKERKERARVG